MYNYHTHVCVRTSRTSHDISNDISTSDFIPFLHYSNPWTFQRLVLALKPEALQGHGRRKRWGAGVVGGARAGDIFYNWLIT